MTESIRFATYLFAISTLVGFVLSAFPRVADASSSENVRPLAPLVDEESEIPFRRESSISGTTLLRTAGATAVGLALVGGGVLGLRRLGYGNDSGWPIEPNIRVIETQRISTKSSLLLVQARGKEILLGQSGDRLSSLHVFDADEDLPSSKGDCDG